MLLSRIFATPQTPQSGYTIHLAFSSVFGEPHVARTSFRIQPLCLEHFWDRIACVGGCALDAAVYRDAVGCQCCSVCRRRCDATSVEKCLRCCPSNMLSAHVTCVLFVAQTPHNKAQIAQSIFCLSRRCAAACGVVVAIAQYLGVMVLADLTNLRTALRPGRG